MAHPRGGILHSREGRRAAGRFRRHRGREAAEDTGETSVSTRWRARAIVGLAVLALLGWAEPSAAAPPRLKAKECLSCHAPVKKEQARSFVHGPFKDAKGCEACHKRHG